jgi:hypothetical protein
VRGIRNILARLRLRWMCRRYTPSLISLPADIKSVKNVLVCLPEAQRQLTMIRQFLPDLSRVFISSEIYLVASPGSSVYDIFPRKGYRIMTPSAGHISWSGLASGKYIDLLKKTDFGIILDLNLQTNYFAQSILLSFPEAIRIGRGSTLGAPFYNIEIKTRFIRDEKNIYKSIFETIERLKNSAAAGADQAR